MKYGESGQIITTFPAEVTLNGGEKYPGIPPKNPETFRFRKYRDNLPRYNGKIQVISLSGVITIGNLIIKKGAHLEDGLPGRT